MAEITERNTYIYLDDKGELREVDIHTGEERRIEEKIEEHDHFKDYMVVHTAENELVYVPKNTEPSILKELQGARFTYAYSPLLAERICYEVMMGKTLKKVSEMPNMPSIGSISRWRRLYPDFDIAYKQAVQDRSEVYIQKMLDEIEHSGADRDEVNLAKLRADFYKYMAKVGNPEQYTEKQQVKAEVAVTGFTIETGIRRPGDEGYNKDETRDVTPSLEGNSDEEV